MNKDSLRYQDPESQDARHRKDIDVQAMLAARDATMHMLRGEPPPAALAPPGAPPLLPGGMAPAAPPPVGGSPADPLGIGSSLQGEPGLTGETATPVPAAAAGGAVAPVADPLDEALVGVRPTDPLDEELAYQEQNPIERTAPEPEQLIPGVRSSSDLMQMFLRMASGEEIDPETERLDLSAFTQDEAAADSDVVSDIRQHEELDPAPPAFIKWLETTKPASTNPIGADLIEAFQENPSLADELYAIVREDAGRGKDSLLPPDLRNLLTGRKAGASPEKRPARETEGVPNLSAADLKVPVLKR